MTNHDREMAIRMNAALDQLRRHAHTPLEGAAKAQDGRHVVRDALGVQLRKEPEPLLGERQREVHTAGAGPRERERSVRTAPEPPA